MASAPDELGPDRRVTPVRLLLAVAAVVLLVFLVWFVFLRADDAGVDAVAPSPVPTSAEETPEPEDTVSGPKKNGPVETFEVFAPKDPFDPLISAATAGGEAGAANGQTGATGEGATETAGDDGTTTTTITGPGGGGGGDAGETVGGRRVRVIDVFAGRNGPRAQIQVDGTVYTVDEGDRFAQNFQLLSASGRCSTMLFGDDEFTLCEGEEILK